MGIYWNNFIYYGGVLTAEQYQQLKAKEAYQKNSEVYCTYLKACGRHYLLHIPQTYYQFDNVGPMFEDHEIKRGFVVFNELLGCLEKRLDEDQISRLYQLPIDQKKAIEELRDLCGASIDIDFHMGQSVWTSLSLPKDDTELEHTLKICFPEPSAGGTYRHYKNRKLYRIIGVGHHTENLEELMVYQALYDDPTYGYRAIWMRPKDMFTGTVEFEGQIVRRFQLTLTF